MRWIFPLMLILLNSCSKPTSPEEVTEEFVRLLSEGDCNAAGEFAIDEALEMIQPSAMAGCDKYETTIVKTECIVTGDSAECRCEEDREGFIWAFNYYLIKVKGDWKISKYEKDYQNYEEWMENQ